MKTVDKFGMEIDSSFHDSKVEEQKEARRMRNRYKNGYSPSRDEIKKGHKKMQPVKTKRELRDI